MSLVASSLAADAGEKGIGVYVQGGDSIRQSRDTSTVFLGVMLPRDGGETSGPVTSYWDLFYGQWHGQQAGGLQKRFNQVGATLMWRRRLDEGRSAWFGEGGVGLSYLDGDYSLPDGRVFGSRATFNGRIGVGRSFGARDEHELSLQYQHFSNGGIRKPNPGTDLLQLRYSYRF